MDTIEFRIVTKEHGYEKLECDVVDIFINGKNFLDTVKNFEKSSGLSPLVFDKKQYFEAVNVLHDWMSDKNLI